MANKKVSYPTFSKKRLKEAFDYSGYNIDTLCKYRYVGRSARQIWRYWEIGEMPADTLDNIARELDVSVDFISGKLDQEIKESYKDPVMVSLLTRLMTPENNPYNKPAHPLAQLLSFYNALFTTYHVPEDAVYNLSPADRLGLYRQINNAIVDVLTESFPEVTNPYSKIEFLLNCFLKIYEEKGVDFLKPDEIDETDLQANISDYASIAWDEIRRQMNEQ